MKLATTLLVTIVAATSIAAQPVAPSLELPNGHGESRLRVDRLLDSTASYPRDLLLRSASSTLDSTSARLAVIAPSILASRNSDFPYSANDGALWAGRGVSAMLRAGVLLDRGPLRVVLAPEYTVSENRAWDVFPGLWYFTPPRYPDRSYFSHFWYRLPWSIDAPYRMGRRPVNRLDAGQSSAYLRLGANRSFEAGLSNENQWWGPSLRNALLLGTTAAGFPHLFARSARPVRTRIGLLEARWLLGGLTESGHFDTVSTNNTRAYTAAAVAWHAPEASMLEGLSLGVSRAVFASVESWSGIRHHTFAIWSGTPRHQRVADTDTTPSHGRDQISTVFGRWTFPRAGMEIHAELGRTELPVSFRDAIIYPEHTLGRTIGFKWARRLDDAGELSVEGEFTNTEQSATFVSRPIGIWYTSRAVPQGYTQRGELLGASIGPSGTAQWLAIDYHRPSWRIGLAAQRIRWNNDFIDFQFANEPVGFAWCHHDVTIAPGLRGDWRPRIFGRRLGRLEGEFFLQNRLNYLFQNIGFCPNNDFRRDVRNRSLKLSWSL
jgi:hypothetical protein